MIDPLAYTQQLPALVEQALRDAGVVDCFPTPLPEIQRVIGIREVLDMKHLPDVVAIKAPSAWKQVLGGILFRERRIFVDFSQAEARAHFTEAHETAHKLIEWHEAMFRLDSEATLFEEIHSRLEEEANYTAALLIFQNGRFHKRALDHARSIQTPIALARDYGASRHVAIRHYVALHPEPVALLIAGRFASAGSIPVWTTVESSTFAAEFGSARRVFDRRLLIDELGGPLGAAAHAALHGTTEWPKAEIELTSLRGEPRKLLAEAFFNQHCLFAAESRRPRTADPDHRDLASRGSQ